MAKMNYAKMTRDRRSASSYYEEKRYESAKDAHLRALRKAWALWKTGKGPKPNWNNG